MMKNLFDITYDHYFQKIGSLFLRFSRESQIKMHSICYHLILTHINIVKMMYPSVEDTWFTSAIAIVDLVFFNIRYNVPGVPDMSTSELRKSVTNTTLSYSIIFIQVTHLFMFVQYVSLSGNKSFSNDVYTSNFPPFSILTRTYLKIIMDIRIVF